jgi:hypothetical protein
MNAPSPSPGNANRDDADPMIDALLAEFVPEDPQQRSRPPDLSQQILARLAECSQPADSQTHHTAANPARTAAAVAAHTPPAASTSALTRMVSLLVAVAASILGVMWLAGDDQPAADEKPIAANLDTNRGVDPANPNTETSATPNGPDQWVARVPASTTEADGGKPIEKPIRGKVLDPPRLADSQTVEPREQSAPRRAASSPDRLLPIGDALAVTRRTAEQYWRDLNLTPTPAASPDEMLARLKRRLGVELSAEALSDPSRLQSELTRGETPRQIAKRWLAVTADAGIAQVDRPENAPLIGRLARGLSGQARWDATLVSLIDGTGEHADKWYETIGRGGAEAIAQRLAGISMNADVRCIRCHDSMIGRTGTQDDYWSFVALVRNVVQRSDDRWIINRQPKSIQTFFELPDGRQRLAVPKVSEHLLESGQEIDAFDTWAATLPGSDALASGMVDSLWQLVHGRTLKPSPVDAFAPPINENLDRLHAQLAEDLTASGFDVARTLALIIASPMSNRSVPEALRGNNVVTVGERERREALDLVAAFAASVQPPRSSQQERLELAMRRIGGSLQPGDQGAILAQPIYNTPPLKPKSPGSQRSGVDFGEALGVDFPGNDAPLPVSWLRSIDDYDQQVQHLVYLSGHQRVTPEIRKIAERLKESGSTESALSRLWWILRP